MVENRNIYSPQHHFRVSTNEMARQLDTVVIRQLEQSPKVYEIPFVDTVITAILKECRSTFLITNLQSCLDVSLDGVVAKVPDSSQKSPTTETLRSTRQSGRVSARQSIGSMFRHSGDMRSDQLCFQPPRCSRTRLSHSRNNSKASSASQRTTRTR